MLKKIANTLSSFQIIMIGFALLIAVGAVLLMLPFSSADGTTTPFINCLFTACSASCVTGLIVYDTATYWSVFGKLILILLIQIGGLGIVTMSVAFMRLSGQKISIRQRTILGDSISIDAIGGIVRLTGFIIKYTLIFELSGAVLLFPVFLRENGVLKSMGLAFFTSISAFCNAGFDLMGEKAAFSSLMSFSGSVYPIAVISLLIIIGGSGFKTWDDIKTNKLHVSRYSLQSKIIIVTSLILIVIPAILFYHFEFSGAQYGELSTKEHVLASVFQAVTTRTAGFNTTDQALLSPQGVALTIFLMLIGGSPGSTAGGMKTTTIAVLFISAISVFRRKDDDSAFGRRLPVNAIRNASAILMIYATLFISFACIISSIEDLPLIQCLYETASAVGTVGLTTGITSTLSNISKIMLALLMFIGRIGGLSIIYAAMPLGLKDQSRFPRENVNIG